jgi:hypothetical protein
MESIIYFYKSTETKGVKYEAVSDGGHRILGITLEGMYRFLEEIGFLEWTLPELWACKWAERTGTAQGEGFKPKVLDRSANCKICQRIIPTGETAYVKIDDIYEDFDFDMDIEGIHMYCAAEGVELEKRCNYSLSLGWRYVPTYQRSKQWQWIRSPLPKLDTTCGYMDTSPGLLHMTGYDLVAFLQDWLVLMNVTDLSVAEVILTDDRFLHLRQYVGLATIFWSHVDSEPVIDHAKGTFVRIREARELYASQLPDRTEQYWWVDYFSLRQGIPNDFDLPAIIQLIQDIGCVVCSLQDPINSSVKTYLTRSFCLIEMFSALLGVNSVEEEEQGKGKRGAGLQLICYGNRIHRSVLEAQLAPVCPTKWRGWWPEQRWVGPVNSADAQTSHAQDKECIDQYILDSFGFEKFNHRITNVLLRCAPCDLHRKVECQLCPVFCFSETCQEHQQEYCSECMDKFEFIGTNAIKCLEHKVPCCRSCY